MSQGFSLEDTEPTILVEYEVEEKQEFERILGEIARAQELEIYSPPTPLQRSLRLSTSSWSSACDSNSRSFASSSSLDVPSLASSSLTSASWDSSIEKDNSEQWQEEEHSELIPYPEPGIHFHARLKEFVIITPSSGVHRLVTVRFNGSTVDSVLSHKPLGAHAPSFSPNDVVISTRGAHHIAVVRRGAKTNRISLTIQGPKSGSPFHLPTKHPNQLLGDFTSHGHPSSAILAMLDSKLYLVGNQNVSHVWTLEIPEFTVRPPKDLSWHQEHSKTFPRPNTRPRHVSGCPRVGIIWKRNLIVIGVEPSPEKRSRPSNTSSKSKQKAAKSSKLQSGSSTLFSAPSHSLNIWQYSIQNRTWAKHQPATNPPQGAGPNFLSNLAGCLVGESVACIAVGRENDTCIWLLNLASWTWSELPGFFPRGARVHGMSAVGSVVYFMGTDLTEDLPSPVVHCDLSTFEPFMESSQVESKTRVKSLIFPPSMSVQTTEPVTPLETEGPSFFPPASQPPPRHSEVAASLLPSYDTGPSPPNPNVATILFFTPYRRLHECHDDSQFEKLKNDLSSEWTTCAMIAMCFIGVNGAIFGFAKDSTVIAIDDLSERAVAVSMLSAVISLAAAAWMYCVYYPQDGDAFRYRARDALNTYAIFSIRARVPFVCDCVAIAAFIVFVLHSLIEVYPEIVVPLAGLIGILVGLNWMVYCYYLVRLVVVSIRRGLGRIFQRTGSDNGDTASVRTVVGTEESRGKHDEVVSVPS